MASSVGRPGFDIDSCPKVHTDIISTNNRTIQVNSFLTSSFRNLAVRMTGTNSAFSYNLKNAISGIYPDYTVAYNLALVSRGDLPNATNPTAAAGTAGKVEFAWINNAGTGKATANDLCIAVAFCPEFKQGCLHHTG